MGLTQEALNLLRAYIGVVEPEALSHLQAVLEGRVVGALCPEYVTLRPAEPLIHTLSQGGKLFWRPQLSGVNIPCPGWFARFDGHPLRAQLVDALLKCLPQVSGERDEAVLSTSAPHAMDMCAHLTVETYLALHIALGLTNKERAFNLAAEILDTRLDPAQAVHHYGCYLYNFKLDDRSISTVQLAGDIEIRLSTFEDLVRQANYGEIDGDYLPPAYMLTCRVSKLHTPLDGVLDINGDDAENVAALDNAIAALRLHQISYVGRGSVYSWTPGPGTSFGRPAPAANPTSLMLIRGDDPPFVPPWSQYELRLSDVAEVKVILQQIRQTAPTDEKVRQAIRLLGARENDWETLYKVHDVVASDVGGISTIVSNGWMTRAKQSLFTQTANNPLAVGDDARHGYQSTQPPDAPMEISEARALISNVVKNWLGSKV